MTDSSHHRRTGSASLFRQAFKFVKAGRRLATILASLVTLAAVPLVSAQPAGAADTFYADAIGGSAGQNYEKGCRGDVLVGFNLRQGSAVDSISLVCATPRKGGFLDPAQPLANSGVGGGGGEAKSLICPKNHALVGVTVLSYGNHDVNDVAIVCRSMETGKQKMFNTNYEPSNDEFAEPAGTGCGKGNLAIGIRGRADSVIHSLGLKCTANPFENTSQPATPPPPQTSDNGGGQGWMAFAKGRDDFWGFNTHRQDKNAAMANAVGGCGGDANGCQVFWTTTDACVAFAMSPAPFFYAAGGGPDENTARNKAIQFCQSGNAPPGSCRIEMSKCP